jgi:hypothetical protein
MRKLSTTIAVIAVSLASLGQVQGQEKKQKSKIDEKTVAMLQGGWQGDLEKTKKLLAENKDVSERDVEIAERIIASLAIQFYKDGVGYVMEGEGDVEKIEFKVVETKTENMLSVAMVEFRLPDEDDGGRMEFVFVDKETCRVTVKNRKSNPAPTLVFARDAKLDLASKYKESNRAKKEQKDSKGKIDERDK